MTIEYGVGQALRSALMLLYGKCANIISISCNAKDINHDTWQ